jgi:GGDEF domain-containing protein
MTWTQLLYGAAAVGGFNAVFFSIRWGCGIQRQLAQVLATSEIDPLTGLGTRRALDHGRWFAALRSRAPLCVGVFEVDQIARQRHWLGREVAEGAVRAAAEALTLACRRGCDEGFVLDVGQGRFLVVLHGALNPASVAAKFRDSFRRNSVQVSGCLAYTTESGFEPARKDLRTLTQEGCDWARDHGGDRVVVISEGIRTYLRQPATQLGGHAVPEPIQSETTHKVERTGSGTPERIAQEAPTVRRDLSLEARRSLEMAA